MRVCCSRRALSYGRRFRIQSRSSSSSSSSSSSPTQQPPQQLPPPPTYQQLRLLALRASIPMIGFGIMDNFVMITAGEAIDSTFGVMFGLSTMAAAGFGQCVSDVAGVTSGGMVDAAVSKLNLPMHGLSTAQLDLKPARVATTVGSALGVLTGCLLGMSVLLLIDTDRADRAKRAKELNSIFESVMDEGHDLVDAERATLFMLDEEKQELWSRVASGMDGIIAVKNDQGLVGKCVQTGEVVNVVDAYQDPSFNQSIDKSTGYRTKSVLVVPIKDANDDERVIGAIQMINKKLTPSPSSSPSSSSSEPPHFTANDENICKVLASHVTAFIRVVDGS